MFSGKSSYGEFLKSDEAMATNILADRLCTLENAGIIEKSQNKEDKRKDIYKLTAKGIDLLPVLIEIILWSAKYDPKTGASKDLVINAKNDRVKLINHIKTTLR